MSKRKITLYLILCHLLLFIFVVPAIAAPEEAMEQHVAILPAIITDKDADKDYLETSVSIAEKKLRRHFRYPYYNCFDSEKINSALSAETLNDGEKLYDEKFLKRVGETLNADIVVLIEIPRMRSYIFQGFRFDETYQRINLVLNCYTYSLKDNKYNKETLSYNKTEILSVSSDLETALNNCADNLLKKIAYQTIPTASAN